MKQQLIISCEHASNKIPKKFAEHYKSLSTSLLGHEGYDIGAKIIYNCFQQLNPSHTQHGRYSRLLIDLNRTLNHPKIFSKTSQQFSKRDKNFIINKYYLPYLQSLEAAITKQTQKNIRVTHVSIHTFTPTLNNQIRNNDIGFLYDSKRALEKEFCTKWRRIIENLSDKIIVRMNYPYLGSANGLTAYFRKNFSPKHYCGIELEINQNIFDSKKQVNDIKKLLIDSLNEALNS